MRTRTRSPKNSRRHTYKAGRKGLSGQLRRYLPWAAAICASAYAPPQLHGAPVIWRWINDGNSNPLVWSNTANWTNGANNGVPGVGDTALFGGATNLTIDRTVTLDTGISVPNPTLGLLQLNDATPSELINIVPSGSAVFQLATTGMTVDVAKNETLKFGGTAVSTMLVNASGNTGTLIIGTTNSTGGLGTVDLALTANTYTGATTLNRGILQVASIGNGGNTVTGTSLGSSSNAAANLVFNDGELRWTGTTASSTDRLFTIKSDRYDQSNNLIGYAATIDASGTAALTFSNTGNIVANGNTGTSTLVLRGATPVTTQVANVFSGVLSDTNGGGAVTRLVKLDNGTWRLTGSQLYTGDTVVQQGILSLDFRNSGGQPILYSPGNDPQHPINYDPAVGNLILGGLPGGGTLELYGGAVRQTLPGDTMILNPGANLVQLNNTGLTSPNTTASYLYVSQISNIKLNVDGSVNHGGALRLGTANLIHTDVGPSDLNGIYGGWLTFNDTWLTGTASGNDFILAAFAEAKYLVVDTGISPPDQWNESNLVSIESSPGITLDSRGNPGGYESIQALRFTAKPSPTKLLTLANADPLDPFGIPSQLNLSTGGLMQASTSGDSQIAGGGLTSSYGEIFANVRAGNLFLSSAVVDYLDPNDPNSPALPVGLTKVGVGTLVMEPNPLNIYDTSYTGPTYVNEGTLAIRTKDGLGDTAVDTFVNGGNLDFQGVNYIGYNPDGQSLKETVRIYDGNLQATLGHASFNGAIISANPDQSAPLVIGTWLDLTGPLSGVAGFTKSGLGTLVVSGNYSIGTSASSVLAVGDLNLTAGNSIWNGGVTLGAGNSLVVTGGQHSINGALSGSRVVITGTTGTLGLSSAGGTYNLDLLLSGGTTVLGSTTPSIASQTYGSASSGSTSNITINGGKVVLDGNAIINTGFTVLSGSFSENSSVNPGLIPAVTFNPATPATQLITFGTATATATGAVTTLNFTNTFKQAPVVNPFHTLQVNGMGLSTFEKGIAADPAAQVLLTNSTIGTGTSTQNYTVGINGLLSLNGLNTVTGLLTVAGGTFQQAGLRRAADSGLYGVRDTFTGGISVISGTAGVAVSAAFNGMNSVGANITVGSATAVSPGFAGFTQTNEAIFNNGQAFNSTLVLAGGQATIQSAQALGAGLTGGGAGVSITGEKSVLQVARGTATNLGEDITLGFTTGFISGVVVTAKGSYTAPPTVAITGGGVGTGASFVATEGADNNSLGAFVPINVGSGYTLANTTVTLTGGTGTGGGSAVAVLAGPTILRSSGQNNTWNGNLILDNVASGAVSVATPLLSVATDSSLSITGNITGSTTAVTSGATRFLTTAIPGDPENSGAGYLLLNGFVRDTPTGAAASTSALSFLRTEWGGNQDLNTWVNQSWQANGMITLNPGVMRFTSASNNFWDTSAGGVTTTALEFSVGNTATTDIGWSASSNLNTGLIGTTAASSIVTANDISFFLTRAGQVLNNTSNINVHNGNTDKLSGSTSGTGFITIGAENTTGTATIGTGVSTITLETDNLNVTRDLRFYANSGGTLDVADAIIKSAGSGTASITKIGDGTVRLLGAGTTTGTASIVNALAGTLEIANLNTSAAPRFATTSAINLGGGTLKVTGNTASASVVNATGNFTIYQGASAVIADNTAATGTAATLNLGTTAASLLRKEGGTVRFVETSANAAITLQGSAAAGSSPIGTGSLLGWGTYGTNVDPTSLNAATNFATRASSGGGIDKFTDTFNNNSIINSNLSFAEASTGTSGFTSTVGNFTISSLRFANPAAISGGTVNISTGSTLTVNEGIMVSSLAGGLPRAITGGFLRTGGSEPDLIIHNYGGDGGSSGPTLTIGSQIIDPGNPAAVHGVTIDGDGTTFFTNNANSFTGNVLVAMGTLSISNDGQLGNAANPVLLDGGTLKTTADITSARNITAFGDRSSVSVSANTTLTLTGRFLSDSSTLASILPSYSGQNAFTGDLVLTGGGTIRQVFDNNANTMMGQLLVQGGTRYIYEGNNGAFLGGYTTTTGTAANPQTTVNQSSFSAMDGTSIGTDAGVATGTSTLEIRPTTGNFTISDFLTLKGAGQSSLGALRLSRATTGTGAATDREVTFSGPVSLAASTTISVDDSTDTIGSGGTAGTMTFTGIFDGGSSALTKTGSGVLRFLGNRTQNLSAINVQAGEVRFEGGITGVVGAATNALVPAAQAANAFSGTSTITVGQGNSNAFGTGARLWFNDARGVHTADITLNNGYLITSAPDAPLQSIDFAGTISLQGIAAANAWEVGAVNGTSARPNPTTVFGAITGTGGFTKLGVNELQLVNPVNDFSGDLIIARGGLGPMSPSVGLYDGGALTKVANIKLTNDGTLYLDNQNGLDGGTVANNSPDRINNAAVLQLGGASRFRIIGNNTTGQTATETMGALRIHAGASAIELQPGYTVAGVSVTSLFTGLTFGSSPNGYLRDAGSSVEFRVLSPGVTFGTATTGNNQASVKIAVPTSALVGSTATNVPGRQVVLGAFGGVATKSTATLDAKATTTLGLNNNEAPYVARNFMTTDSGYIRPLKAAEMYQPALASTATAVTDVFQLDKASTQGNNLQLLGGFGPFTSYFGSLAHTDQGVTQIAINDDSMLEDSSYRVSENYAVNTLSFAQSLTKFTPGAGNRVLLEIDPKNTLTVTSGMILAGGVGVLSSADPNAADTVDLRSYIRGGTLAFGAAEAIIQTVAASFRTADGSWSSTNGDLTIFSAITGTGGLTKSGAGTLVLAGNNSYSGTTQVNAGALRLQSDNPLGSSSLVQVSGTGEVHLAGAVSIGSALAPKTLLFSNLGSNGLLRNDGEHNSWHGDIQLDTTNSAGIAAYTPTISVAPNSSLSIYGNIYGTGTPVLNTGTNHTESKVLILGGETSPTVTGRSIATGGILELHGSIQDNASGPVSAMVNSQNQSDLLRVVFAGGSNEQNTDLYGAWNSAGSISFRQGIVRLMPDAGSTFYTPLASSRINTTFSQSRPVIGDAAGGDVALFLSASGQSFNAPNLTVGNGSADATYTIGGLNSSGIVTFMSNIGNATADATQRINTWDHNVRIYSRAGGEVDVLGKITDSTGGGGITKIGRGTVRMLGMDMTTPGWENVTASQNNFGKQVVLAGGSLLLDYGTNHAGTLSGGTLTNGWGNSGAGLVLAGGSLELIGDSTYNVAQTYTGLSMRPGGNELVLNPGAGHALNLTINGTFLQQPPTGTAAVVPTTIPGRNGGTLNIVALPGAGGGTSTLTIAASGSTAASSTTGGYLGAANSVLGAWATYGTARNSADTYAFRNSSNQIVPLTYSDTGVIGAIAYAQTDPGQWAAGTHVSESASAGFNTNAAASGVKTIRFSNPTSPTLLNLPIGMTLGNAGVNDMTRADEGGILVPTGVTALKTIQGGSLTVNGNKDLDIENYGTGGLNISSRITGALQTLVIAGTGTTRLTATSNFNNYTGATFLNGGVLEVQSLADSLNVVSTSITVIPDNTVTQGAASNTATVVTGTGVQVGQLIDAPGLFPAGTVVTRVLAATATAPLVVELSNVASSTGTASVTNFGNSLAVQTANTALNFNGGTLRFTNNVAGTFTSTGRSVNLGGSGGTIDIANAGVNLTISGVVSSQQNPALQAGTTLAEQNRNSFVGDLIKAGPGILQLSSTGNTYQGLTDVRAGILSTSGVAATGQSVATGLGTSFGEADGTVVRNGATLRFQQTASFTTNEWITLQDGAALDAYSTTTAATTSNDVYTLNGGLTVGSITAPGGRVAFTYSGDTLKSALSATTYSSTILTPTSGAGNLTVQLGTPANNAGLNSTGSGGFVRGGGTIVKMGANNFQGGVLAFYDSNPDWTGGLEVQGGKVLAGALGTPLGTGTTPIQLGNAGSNTIVVGDTPSTAALSGEADLYFSPENDVLTNPAQTAPSTLGNNPTATAGNGNASANGLPDTVPGAYHIAQAIVVNKPADGLQVKRIGVVNPVNSLDTFNFDGNILINDDFEIHAEGALLNTPSNGMNVNINLKGNLVTQNPGLNGLYGQAIPPNGVAATQYLGNITTTMAFTTRDTTADFQAYHPIFLNLTLSGDNRNFHGAITLGNQSGSTADLQYGNSQVSISNPALNHVLIVGSDNALNEGNQINLYDESTLKVNGHSVSTGSIYSFTTGLNNSQILPIQFLPGVSLDAGTTAQIPHVADPTNNDPSVYTNLVLTRSIIENASATPATLTVNQTVGGSWNALIRDGVKADGTASAPLSIVKTGQAVAEIQNFNTYTGTTTVVGGLLQVNTQQDHLVSPDNFDSGTGTGEVIVQGQGGLSGNGVVGGHVTLSGVIAPGITDVLTGAISTGQLQLGVNGTTVGGVTTKGVTSNSGTVLKLDIFGPNAGQPNNGYDQILTPTMQINGTFSFQINETYAPVVNVGDLENSDRFDIIVASGGITIGQNAVFDYYGNVTGLGQDINVQYLSGDQLVSQLFLLKLSDDKTTLSLYAVPEPGTVATLASGVGMLLGLQRFRRRNRRA